MAIGKTPQNQLNALPLQDADSAAAGGQIQIVGGSMVRYFDAVTLGLNGVGASTFTSGAFQDFGLVTPFLNLIGCNKFNIVIRANTTIARAALPAIHPQYQMRMGVSDNPPVLYANGAGIQQGANGVLLLGSTGLTFPATSGTESQTGVIAFEGPQVANNSGVQAPSTFTPFGSDVRFLLTSLGASFPAQTTFTVNIWAQT